VDKLKKEYRDEIITYIIKYIKTDQIFLHELLSELHKIEKNQKKAEEIGTEPMIPTWLMRLCMISLAISFPAMVWSSIKWGGGFEPRLTANQIRIEEIDHRLDFRDEVKSCMLKQLWDRNEIF